jgi:uncharacterized repeat protein (TIGR03803 family)
MCRSAIRKFRSILNGSQAQPLALLRNSLIPGSWLVGLATLLLWQFAYADTTFTTLKSFNGTTDGSLPYGALIIGSDGNFYGSTSSGGTYSLGTIFLATPFGQVSTIGTFDGTNGAQPLAELIQASNGTFYGTTTSGGTNNQGTVFSATTAGTITSLVSFNGTNGAQPQAGLLMGPNGVMYGTTGTGGSNNLGTVFSITAAGVLTTLVTFNGTNGEYPLAGLTAGGDGNFYGTTSAGGDFNAGTAFQLTPAGGFTTLHSFVGSPEGAAPRARLLKASDGNLYGTTAGGGTNSVSQGGDGTAFKMTTAGALTTLASFGGTNGSKPFAGLIQGQDGNFYGTTFSGSISAAGSIFQMSSTGVLSTVYTFRGGVDGANSTAALLFGNDGNLYGTTSGGGTKALGTIFEVSGFTPFIVTQPASQTVISNTTVTFTTSASGSSPLTYRWQFNTNFLSDGGAISGSATPTLTINNAVPTNSGNYAVVVANASGSVTSSVAVLTVVDPFGTEKPVVTIVNPAQGAIIRNTTLNVTGKATGTVAVAQVFYQINSSGWQLASTSNSWTNWSATVSLIPGTNVLQAYAVNLVNNPSLTNTVSFLCSITGGVANVQINGNGTLVPNYNGKALEIGRTYTMTARPAVGYIFAGWSGTVTSSLPKLSFIMVSNLFLQADFVPNPFTPVKGIYHGLFHDPAGVAVSSAGSFTLTVAATGKYSGLFLLAGARVSLTGQLDATGHGHNVVARRNQSSVTVDFQLDLSQGSDQVTGTVTDGTWTAELLGDRAVFDGRTSLAPQAGQYTMVIAGNDNPDVSPGGDGYGTISVDKAGNIRLAGFLADGTRLSQAVPLSKNGQWPFFASLYTGQGMVIGWLSFTNALDEDLTGDVVWIKPPSATSKVNRSGFTNLTSASGSHYTRPASGTTILQIANGELSFSEGVLSQFPTNELAQTFTNLIVLSSNNHVQNLSSNKLTLTFSQSSGSFSGRAGDPFNVSAISFGGVVLQKQNQGAGFFIRNGESGLVLLEQQ